MNDIKIFENAEFGSVRTVEVNGEPYFVGKDVAEILKYNNPNEAISDHIDEEDKLNSKTLSSCELNLGQRGGWLINESGLYSLILSSKLPKAKEFKHWVTSEVLPSIRKHGAYMTDEALHRAITEPDFLIQLANELKEEKQKRKVLEAKVEQDKPLVLFADSVQTSHTSILVGELAKILKQNGVDIGQKRLFEWLRTNGYLMKSGSSRNIPTQYAMEHGWFEIKESSLNMPDGSIRVTKTTKVTGKGQIYFVNRFLNREKERVKG